MGVTYEKKKETAKERKERYWRGRESGEVTKDFLPDLAQKGALRIYGRKLSWKETDEEYAERVKASREKAREALKKFEERFKKRKGILKRHVG